MDNTFPKFFVCDNLKNGSKSFKAQCSDQDEIDNLFDCCSDFTITEVDQSTYEEAVKS